MLYWLNGPTARPVSYREEFTTPSLAPHEEVGVPNAQGAVGELPHLPEAVHGPPTRRAFRRHGVSEVMAADVRASFSGLTSEG